MEGQVHNVTLLFGNLTPPCSLSCPEADGKAMEKPWKGHGKAMGKPWKSHGKTVVHTGSRHCPATLGHPQRHKQWHLGSLSSVQQPSLFLTFNGQLYSFQMFFSPGGIEGQQVRSIWRASSSLLLQYDCVCCSCPHARSKTSLPGSV